MRGLPIYVIAMLLPLAGCLGGGDDGMRVDEGEPAAAVHELSLVDCSETVAVLPIPMDWFEGGLPEGFQPQAMDPAGQAAMVIIMAYGCSYTDSDGEARMHHEALALLPVDVPGPYRVEGVEIHALTLASIVDSEEAAELFGSWGFASDVGTVTIASMAPDSPATRLSHVLAQTDEFDVHAYVAALGPAADAAGGAMRAYALSENGTISGAMDVEWTGYQYAEGVSAYAEGAMPGIPNFAHPGVGAVSWGWDLVLRHAPLPAVEDMDDDHAHASGFVWRGVRP